MAIGSFRAEDKNIKRFFKADDRFYVIPRYQRGYSWKKNQWDMFWTDLTTETLGMFMGSVLLNSTKKPNVFEVVDGQQRTLTVTILLSVVRDKFHELSMPILASKIQTSYISDSGGFGEMDTPRVKTGSDLDDYFHKSIQTYPRETEPEAITKQQKTVKSARSYFEKEVNEYIEKSGDANAALTGLIQRIEGLTIISIEVEDEDDAYKVFESVNAKGADLTIADILKNMIFRVIKPSPGEEDLAQKKWSQILQNLEGSGITMSKFIRYYWMSKYKFLTEKELYHEIKLKTGPKGNLSMNKLMNDLVSSSFKIKDYLSPTNQNMAQFEKGSRRIVKSLNAINCMKVRQCIPFFLSIDRNVDLKNKWQRIFEITEKFSFQYHAVAGMPANKVERKYSHYAREIERCATITNTKLRDRELNSTLDNFENDLKELCPNYETFCEKFITGMNYSASSNKKSVINYVLTNINDHLTNGTGELVIDDWYTNIEHILPQKPEKWGLTEEEISNYVHEIGNLTVLSKKINSQVGNSKLTIKKVKLSESDLEINRKFVKHLDANENIWDSAAIRKRSQALAETAHNIWCMK